MKDIETQTQTEVERLIEGDSPSLIVNTLGINMTKRNARRSGTMFFVFLVVIFVGFYTALTMNQLDSSHQDDAQITNVKYDVQSASAQNVTDSDEQVTAKPAASNDSTPKKESCKGFDHGDTSPTEGVTSIFNCNSDEGKCKYFYPAKFLDSDCGIGKEFQPMLQEMKDLYASSQLWLNGPPIVIPTAMMSPAMKPSQYHEGPWATHNISMTHVHKTGGTSLVSAFSAALRLGAKGKRHTVYMPGRKRMEEVNSNSKSTPPRQPSRGSKSRVFGSNYKTAAKFVEGAVKYQKEWGEKDHTLLAVIRDPAERFISAIGQATGAYGSAGNGIGKQLLSECSKSTSKLTLRCFIDLMKTNSTWIEVHFTPIVLEISFATVYNDIPVAVFPFTEVPDLLRELGSNPNKKIKDGHKKGYRKNEVLTNMTFADYDDDMLKDLCEVYKMDAMFLKQIGYKTHCEGVLKLD